MDFDAPVADRLLPWFRMKDPRRTLEVTVRDMTSHRVGLPYGLLVPFYRAGGTTL